MDDVGFTGKTFLKFRDFLLRSYLNPQKSKSSFGRTFYNFYSSDDLDKHFPGEKILSCFSDDEVNKILSFARNPNPLRSLIFKWENLRDNPFHTFWKLHPMTNFRHDIIESELDLVNERIFFTKKELLEDYEKSAPDDVPDLSSFGKEIQYLAKKGIVRTFSKENGFTDFHSFNTFPSDLNFQTCFLFRLLVMFSRIGPCSVLASFILDKFFDNPEFEFPIIFRGDKKFLISSLHSQTMYNIFDSISKQCSLHIEYIKNKENLRLDVTALSIVCNSYTGRFYLLYMLKNKSKLYSCPINNIYEAKVGELLEKPPYIDQILSQKFENIWDLEDENFYDNYQFFSFSFYYTFNTCSY